MRKKKKDRYKNITCDRIDSDNLIVDTTRKESFQIIELCTKLKKYLILILLITGTISTLISIQYFMGYELFSSRIGLINFILIGIIGFANIFCGLLLLGSE